MLAFRNPGCLICFLFLIAVFDKVLGRHVSHTLAVPQGTISGEIAHEAAVGRILNRPDLSLFCLMPALQRTRKLPIRTEKHPLLVNSVKKWCPRALAFDPTGFRRCAGNDCRYSLMPRSRMQFLILGS